jgi:NAD(P)-dependent dehydrogenase (short-subunit alcohol dehydrogenase family)
MAGASMQNKICMVTGATGGIGKVTARELARRGAEVIIVGRDHIKSESAVSSIRRDFPKAKVSYLFADLSNQTQIRQLAKEFRDQYKKLDVLINNVGGIFFKRQLSVDGIEMTFALNHLSYFLLTNILLDLLDASKAARVINVSSSAHNGHHLDFDDLQSKYHYNGRKVYGRTKLANILYTYELARQTQGTSITTNALHPGTVKTNFGNNNFWILYRLFWFRNLRDGLTPEQGAQTILYLACSPEVNGISGKYFFRKKAVRSSDASYDQESAHRLWEISKQLVNLKKHLIISPR